MERFCLNGLNIKIVSEYDQEIPQIQTISPFFFLLFIVVFFILSCLFAPCVTSLERVDISALLYVKFMLCAFPFLLYKENVTIRGL